MTFNHPRWNERPKHPVAICAARAFLATDGDEEEEEKEAERKGRRVGATTKLNGKGQQKNGSVKSAPAWWKFSDYTSA